MSLGTLLGRGIIRKLRGGVRDPLLIRFKKDV